VFDRPDNVQYGCCMVSHATPAYALSKKIN
jgi:hypothetical protein